MNQSDLPMNRVVGLDGFPAPALDQKKDPDKEYRRIRKEIYQNDILAKGAFKLIDRIIADYLVNRS